MVDRVSSPHPLTPTCAVQVCPEPVGVALSGSRVFVDVISSGFGDEMSLKPNTNYPLETDTEGGGLGWPRMFTMP